MADAIESDWPRLLADARGESPGPTLVVAVGIHGNELESVRAARRLAEDFRAEPPRRGRLILVVGNRRALQGGRRCVDRDLNRLWEESHVRAVRDGRADPTVHEFEEMVELLRVFDDALRPGQAFGSALLDLHCFSGRGLPFSIGSSRPENVQLGSALGLPYVLGLQEALGGALSDYYDRHCTVSMAVEGGQIGDPRSEERHLELLRRSSVALGLVDPDRFDLEALPPQPSRRYRISFRYPVEPGDGFSMVEGFSGFDEVRRGRLLAHDHAGEIRAPHDAVLLMPLYQPEGKDGFFLAQPVEEQLP